VSEACSTQVPSASPRGRGGGVLPDSYCVWTFGIHKVARLVLECRVLHLPKHMQIFLDREVAVKACILCQPSKGVILINTLLDFCEDFAVFPPTTSTVHPKT